MQAWAGEGALCDFMASIGADGMALIRGHAICPGGVWESLTGTCSESVEHDPRHDAQVYDRTRAIAAV